MAKRALPESVKIDTVALTLAATGNVYQAKLNLALGRNEVAVLLGTRAILGLAGASSSLAARWALWKKSDADWPIGGLLTPAELAAETDIVASGVLTNLLTTSGRSAGPLSEDFLFPFPLVVIRPPQFIAETIVGTSYELGLHVYYLIQEVDDKTLAKLLVKDHD